LYYGIDFAPHNVLELLLFYAVPQKDTNQTAHLLIDRFGSLDKVFDATVEELKEVNGIGDHAATLIKLIPALARRYAVEKNKDGLVFNNVDTMRQYFVSQYIGVTVETVLLLSLDNKFNAIDCVKIHEGSVNSCEITVRKLAEIAFRNNASMVVLAHNHPSGLPIPSSADLYTTQQLCAALNLLGIKMLAHIVVAGEDYANIMDPKAASSAEHRF
jgi:DNA repair protein RadC